MKLKSWNGNSINDGTNYDAVWGQAAPHGLPAVGANALERIGTWPLVRSISRAGRTLDFTIYIRSGSAATLASWFNPEDETPKQLIVEDAAGGNDRYVYGICERFEEVPRMAGKAWLVSIRLHGDVRWRKTTASTDTWAITASGQTKVLTNSGLDDAYMIMKVKPTTAKIGGFLYGRWIPIRWRVDTGFVKYPIDITNDSLDTAALVADTTRSVQINVGGGINAAVTTITYDTEVGTFPSSGLAYVDTEQISYTGKSGTQLTGCTRGVNGTTAATHADNAVIRASKIQADGDDLRVYVNTLETNRWTDGMNTSTTKVFCNLSFQPKQEVLLGTAIASSGAVSTITSLDSISGFPSAGILMIGTEAFTYTGKSNVSRTFTGCTRAVNGTSMAAHAISDTIWWVQFDLWIYYGNDALTAPAVDDDQKPAFGLAGSTNTSWDYTEFKESDGLRSGSWAGSGSGAYGGDRGSAADPWVELGITNVVPAYPSRWKLYNPCGITNANFQGGESYRESLSETIGGKIQSSPDGQAYTDEYAIAEPIFSATWTAWSRNEAMTAGTKYIYLWAGYLAFGSSRIYIEASQVMVTLDSNYTPTLAIGSEQSIYQLDCTITNTTTGDVIQIDYSMVLNEQLEIDTDEKTVTYLKDGSNQFPALVLSGGARKDWLKLAPGANTLRFDDAGTAGVTIDFEWMQRSYQ